MPPYDHKKIIEICKRFSIELIYAFGSRQMELKRYVEGTGPIDRSDSSDFDIGIKAEVLSSLSARDKSEITIALEDLYKISRVDLVVINEANPFLAANIIRGERIYCRYEHNADEYELYILRRAGDLVPLERQRLKIIFNE